MKFDGVGLKLIQKHIPEAPTEQAFIVGLIMDIRAEPKTSEQDPEQVRKRSFTAFKQLKDLEGSLKKSVEIIHSLNREGKDTLQQAILKSMLFSKDHEDQDFLNSEGWTKRLLDKETKKYIALLTTVQTAQKYLEARGNCEPARRGRPRNLFAHEMAETCQAAFEELANTSTTLSVNPANGRVYGRYFEFVEDTFARYSISASPERYARDAMKNAKDKNR